MTILTHCTSVKFKSEGDVVVIILRQYRHRLYVHWFKVVADNSNVIVVPLECLQISTFCFLESNNFTSTYLFIFVYCFVCQKLNKSNKI